MVHAGAWDDFIAVPISENQQGAALQVCAVVERDPAGSGKLVVLRETLDARVLLGCVIDEARQVHRWLELWVQEIAGFAQTPAAARGLMNNQLLDQQWRTRCLSLAAASEGDVIRGAWERVHPLPLVIDVDAAGSGVSAVAVHPAVEGSGEQWSLCEDDDLLTQHGLPAYNTTLHRYLVAADGGPKFMPVNSDAPTNDATVPAESVLAGRLAFNLGGGLMMVRTHDPLTYDQFIDLLSGMELSSSAAGPMNDGLSSIARSNSDHARDSGRLFLGRQGRSARLLESFHLKLRVIADAVASVRQIVRETQKPLLDLRSDHFRVRVGPFGIGLPALWTARTMLSDPPEAMAVPFEATAHRYFLPSQDGSSIYKVSASTRSVQGRGSMRLRQVIDNDGEHILEGTFATQERIEPASGDLLWMRLPLGASGGSGGGGGSASRIDVYATLDAESALAVGEWRFRTHARKFDEHQRKALLQMEGVPVENVLFDLVPLLSTPCDLYSLAVLAARTLLVNDETTLAVAMDEVHSLARQLASQHDESVGLDLRMQVIFEDDQRWATGIGPQRLVRERITAEDAFAAIPMDLWFCALGIIVRALPGNAAGPDSFCRNLGDVAPGALHAAFDGMLEELELLIQRTRSLITSDWRANREIHAVAREMAGMRDEG